MARDRRSPADVNLLLALLMAEMFFDDEPAPGDREAEASPEPDPERTRRRPG